MMADLPQVILQPGEVCFARSPAILRTLLGSCVGVTFWSPRVRAGALCHGVLPIQPAGEPEDHRYVDASIRYLAAQFDALRVRRDEVEIKAFGGADVLSVTRADKLTVGALNVRAALRVLEEEGFRISASDLGGDVGRTIVFHTGTGEVLVRRLDRLGGLAERRRVAS